MHAEQDRAARPGAAAHWTPVVLDGFADTAPRADTTRVVIASDREVMLTAWHAMLPGTSDIAIMRQQVTDASDLSACLERHAPNVLLLDRSLLDRFDPSSLRKLHQHCPHVRVLLLSDELCPGLAANVLCNRFHGFLLATSPPDICLKAIRAVCNGEIWLSRASLAMAVTDLLRSPEAGAGMPVPVPHAVTQDALTPRELQVVELLRRGCINKEIARELGIMEDTVKKHLQSVFGKLGVHRRALVAMRGLPGYAATHSMP